MSTILIKSDNPNFSFILRQNPESGVNIKSLRQGNCMGFYSTKEPDTYVVTFQDHPEKMSFSSMDYNYLDTSRYLSPMSIILSLMTILRDCLLKQHEDDLKDQYTTTVTVPRLKLKGLQVGLFEELGVTVTLIEELSPTARFYKLELITKDYIRYTVTLMYLCLVVCIKKEELKVEESFFQKLFRLCKDQDIYLSYRWVNALKNRIVYSAALFGKIKLELEDLCKEKNITLHHGNLSNQRREWISNYIADETFVIDLGCGNGNYLSLWSKKKSSLVLIDIEQQYLDLCLRRIDYFHTKGKNINLIGTATSFTEAAANNLISPNSCVLITEVLEHMPVEVGQELVKEIISHQNVVRVIATVPNELFNIYYTDAEEEEAFTPVPRLADHAWESKGLDYFIQYITVSLAGIENLTIKYSKIGDLVNNECPTVGVVITKNLG